MAANDPNSPRQKMINLMYLVFIAMLALNVSNEVLDGFELVEDSLLRSVKSSTNRNDLIFNDLKQYHTVNEEKTRIWYAKAEEVKQKTDSLYNYVQDLKMKIVKKSDGKDGDPAHLKHPDDLNASFEVMFEKGKNDGKKLKGSIDNYRDFISTLILDTNKREMIQSNLSTEPSVKAKENKQTWEESMFDKMPVAAAVTLLTKIQNDVRYAEGEVLSTLLKSIDVGDLRVNKIQAYVVPESKLVMQNSSTYASIILAAEDTTLLPRVKIDGLGYLPDDAHGRYALPSGGMGPRKITGQIETKSNDGTVVPYPFQLDYVVIQPAVSISPTLMNVLYKGIPNEIVIAAPGVSSESINASMTNGSITRKNNDVWIATPANAGQDAVITVTARMSNQQVKMGDRKMSIRPLPDPSAYFEITDANGNLKRSKGGRIPKATLVNLNELKAAIDDGILNIAFSVIRFDISITDSMGNTIREQSSGSNFSQKQKDIIRGLQRGKPFYIRGIVARGPDGTEREIGVLEVIVN